MRCTLRMQGCTRRNEVVLGVPILQNPKHALQKIAGDINRLRWGKYYVCDGSNLDIEAHLHEAAQWLVRAQDAGADQGVSYGARFGGDFYASYPETTGYIIPTFLKLAEYYQDEFWLQRAIKMGNWEIEVQMDCGAVMSGKLNANPTPALFNTGQVLFGWAALYNKTRQERFLAAARRAADWMLEMQEQDGNWTRGNSILCDSTTMYNVKAAWGLCEAGLAGGWDDVVKAGTLNAEYCVSRMHENGWIPDCCLTNASQPLLHSQAYAMQGLVGIGALVNRSDFIEAATCTADALVDLMTPDGFLPGRFDRNFRGTVSWCCLTGTAQTAIVWGRLHGLTGRERYRTACMTANRYLIAHHNISHENSAIRGGVTGSWPVWGSYKPFAVVNWATNFFVEALLTELDISGAATTAN